jgi:hypothetical protein
MSRARVLEAIVRLTIVHAMLAIAGVPRTRRWLARTGSAVNHVRAERVAGAMQRAAHHFPLGTNCLDRALALWWMLGARGLAATLQIGVRKDEDALAAHAWVEHAGEVLLDDTATHYVALGAEGR